ncbi:hypothetical protein ES703_25085 [subsurface metagenome]
MNSNSQGCGFTLDQLETIAVYLFLKAGDKELESTLRRLLFRIEKKLYDEFTIEEFESLSELYHKKIDFGRPQG